MAFDIKRSVLIELSVNRYLSYRHVVDIAFLKLSLIGIPDSACTAVFAVDLIVHRELIYVVSVQKDVYIELFHFRIAAGLSPFLIVKRINIFRC